MSAISAIFILLALFSLGLVWKSLDKIKQGKFYEDVFWLFPLGIFVWGDAIVFGIFWAGAFVSMIFLPLIWSLRLFLFFHLVRSLFEIIYWLNHQSVKNSFISPLLRNIKRLKAEDSAILFQTFQTVIAVTTGFILLGSFFWK